MSCLTVQLYTDKDSDLGVTQYKLHAGPCNAEAVLRLYLGGDGADIMQLLDWGKPMAIILKAWLVKIHE